MKRIVTIEGRDIHITCVDILAAQADWLATCMRGIIKTHGSSFLCDGVTIRFGWSLLKLIQHDEHYAIAEPDFSTNPFISFREDLTSTLRVQMEQNELLQLFELEGQPTTFDQKMIVAKGCLTDAQIYLERKAATDHRDSGWYAGFRRDRPGPIENEAIYVYQLLYLRPSILQALALPVGYLVVIDGDEIDSVVNEKNEPPWQK